MTVWAVLHFCHLVKTRCLCPCERYNLPPAARPPSPHSLICAICNITVAMKKVAENPAVLASQQKYVVIKH